MNQDPVSPKPTSPDITPPATTTPTPNTSMPSDSTFSSPATGPVVSSENSAGPVVGSASPAGPQPSNKKRSMKAMLIAAVAAVVLLGGSAAAYFGIVVPNKPENQFKQAIQNTIDGKNTAQATKGRITFNGGGTSGALDINMLYVDPANQTALADLKYTVSGIDVPFEIRYVGGNAYVKAGDLSTISSLAASSGGASAAQTKVIIDKVSNQWIEIDKTLIDKYRSQMSDSTTESTKCSAQELSTRSRAAVNEWLVLVSDENSGVYTVTNSSSEDVDGVPTTKIELSVDSTKITELAKQAEELPAFKSFEECLGEAASTKEAEATADSSEITKFNVWIDGDKNFKRVEVGSKATAGQTTGEMTADFTFVKDAPTVEKPADAKPLAKFIAELQALTSGGASSASPLDSLSL